MGILVSLLIVSGVVVSMLPGHAALWSLVIFAGVGVMLLGKAND